MLTLEGMMNALGVGERLAEIRKSRKISQAKFAPRRRRRYDPELRARTQRAEHNAAGQAAPWGIHLPACNGSNKFVSDRERPDAQSPAFIPTERHVSRYRNEIATGREDPGTRAISHRRGVCDPRPTVRGAWARSKHHLDHSESRPQGLRSIRRGHQPHVVVARASSARPSEKFLNTQRTSSPAYTVAARRSGVGFSLGYR